MDKSSTAYKSARAKANSKFKEKTSAYKSMYIVREYKKAGGKMSGAKPKNTGLTRWNKEKWTGAKGKPCGRSATEKAKGVKKRLCRPSKKVTEKTPKTRAELGKKEMKRRAVLKTKNPSKTIRPKKKSTNKV